MTAVAPLTPKQQEVYDHLEHGREIDEIADAMGISEAGVNSHIRNMRSRGVELPGERLETNGNGHLAGRDVGRLVAGTGFADPRDSLRRALAQLDTRTDEIGSEIEALKDQIEDLKAERVELETNRTKYNAALEALT